MIENKELGLVIAEDEEEKFWIEIRDNMIKDITNLEKMLKFNKSILEMANTHIHENNNKKDK